MKAAQALRENESISKDIILMFDEIHIQQTEEYVGGESFGCDEEGQLYKGVVCFMIIGLKKSVPYVIKAVPEIKLSKSILSEEILKSIESLQKIGFNIRAVVSDNHASNVAAFRDLSEKFSYEENKSKIFVSSQAIYMFYDTVHIVKNLRNNLLCRKRFLFPPFSCSDLCEPITVAGGEVSWSLLHRVHEEDEKCQANLRAAPHLSSKVLHPSNVKQSVSVALAIFDPSTTAAILKYFPRAQDAADFLQLIHTWWLISNSKAVYNSRNKLGNAVVPNDGKPLFLRKLADWLEEWQDEKIPNSQKFTLSAQTNVAMVQTLRCQAALIEDLLSEGYKYVLTAKFQSDPLERRYGQYRQMSGGRFLVSLKDVSRSENILKIKTLVKEGFDVTPSLKVQEDYSHAEENLLFDVDQCLGDVESIQLGEESRQISDNIAGYLSHKTRDVFASCCGNNLKSEEASSGLIGLLSRGNLINPSVKLGDMVSKAFALLDASSNAIRKCSISSKKAGTVILSKYLDTSGVVCEHHQLMFSNRLVNTICNCFFDSRRKRSNETVVQDRVASFKKCKRDKI